MLGVYGDEPEEAKTQKDPSDRAAACHYGADPAHAAASVTVYPRACTQSGGQRRIERHHRSQSARCCARGRHRFFPRDRAGKGRTGQHITALRTDMGQVERMKIEVLGALDGLIDRDQYAADRVFRSEISCCRIFWPGQGRSCPSRPSASPYRMLTSFSDFSEAGINQTLQTLKVKFTISLTILTTVGYEIGRRGQRRDGGADRDRRPGTEKLM